MTTIAIDVELKGDKALKSAKEYARQISDMFGGLNINLKFNTKNAENQINSSIKAINNKLKEVKAPDISTGLKSQFTQVVQQAADFGKQANEKFKTEFSKDLGKDVFKDLGKSSEKSGDDSGKKFSEGFKKIAQKAGSLITGGLTAGASAIIGDIDFSGLMNKAKTFQDSLAGLSQVSGVQGQALSDLGDKARELSSRFGTDGTAQIDTFKGVMASLGPGLAQNKDALGKMAENVNVFSKATGLDAKQSTEALTSAMQAFNVSLNDPIAASTEMASMMNVMSAGAKTGAADIPQISQALNIAGDNAKKANVSFEETNAAILVMAQGGVKGAEAGNVLNTALGNLQSGSAGVSQTLKQLGTSSDEVSKILTTQGLGAALDKIKGGMNGLSSDYQKNAALASIFGQNNVQAGQLLVQGAGQMEQLKTAITGTTAAYDQAATKQNTFSEQIKIIQSTIEDGLLTAFVQVVQILTPILQQVAGLLQSVFNNPETQAALKSLGDLIGAVLADAIKLVLPIIQTLMGIFNRLIPIIDAILQPVLDLAVSLAEPLSQALGAVGEIVIQVMAALSPFINALIGALKPTIGEIATTFVDLVTIVAELAKNTLPPLMPLLTSLGNLLGQELTLAVKMALGNIQLFITIAGNLYKRIFGGQTYMDGFKNAFKALGEVVKFTAGIISKIVNGIASLYQGINNVIGAIGKFFSSTGKTAPIVKTREEIDKLAESHENYAKRAGEPIPVPDVATNTDKQVKAVTKASSDVNNARKKYESEYAEFLKRQHDLQSAETKRFAELENNEKIASLQKQKDEILKNEAILGSERLAQSLEIEKKINAEKLRIDLANLNASYEERKAKEAEALLKFFDFEKTSAEAQGKIQTDIQKAIKDEDLNALEEVLAKSKLTSDQRAEVAKQLITALGDYDKNYAKEKAQITDASANQEFNTVISTQKQITEFSKKEAALQEQNRIAAIQDSAQREYELEIFNARQIYQKKVEEAEGNKILEIKALAEYQTARLKAEQDFYNARLSYGQKALNGIVNAMSQAFGSLDFSSVTQNTDNEVGKIDDQIKSLKDSYLKGQGNYEDYVSKLNDLDKQRSEALAKQTDIQAKLLDELNKQLSKSFLDTAKQFATANTQIGDKLKTNLQEQAKLIADAQDTSTEKVGDGMARQFYLAQKQDEMNQMLQDSYANMGVVIGTTFLAMEASGKSFTKSMVLALLAGLKAMVPLFVVEIFGKQLGELGLLGLVSAGALTGVLYGLLSAAEAAVGSLNFETGGLVPGGEKKVTVNERGQEFIMNSVATRKNLAALKEMNRDNITVEQYAIRHGLSNKDLIAEMREIKQLLKTKVLVEKKESFNITAKNYITQKVERAPIWNQ